METKEIADKLVEYCRNNEWERAYLELFADDAKSIECKDTPAFPRETIGRNALIAKGKSFDEQLGEVYNYEVSEPLVAGNYITLKSRMSAEFKGFGKMDIEEICLYQVENGKIILEQFFYD